MKKEAITSLLICLGAIFVALVYVNYGKGKINNIGNKNNINYSNQYNVSNETIAKQDTENIQENVDNQIFNLLDNQVETEMENASMSKNNTDVETSNSLNSQPTTGSERTNEKNNDSSKYYIKVNNNDNKINIYEKNEKGEYSILTRAMVCSAGTHTPSSKKYPKKTYKIDGQRYKWLYLQGNVYGQYATRITGHILFHSVPYKSKNKSSLEYWEFDKLGTTASLGCIRLQVEDAKWIYDNITKGTTVEFETDITNDATSPKISENKYCRNWDPTDESDQNPWNENSN